MSSEVAMPAAVMASRSLPSRAEPRGTERLELLFDAAPGRGTAFGRAITATLAGSYGGPLTIPLRPDRPTLVANFVETLDGVVAMDRHGQTGGGEVSGFSPTDRFVMGLLRGLADVVLVGASTVRSSPRGQWTAASIAPDFRREFAQLRERLGLKPSPVLFIATESGDLDPDHPVFADPSQAVVIAAQPAGADRLARVAFGRQVAVERLAHDGAEGISELVAAAQQRGARVVLSEAGPHLFGQLLAADAVDELFLTVAPQLAGRTQAAPRLGLVEGIDLWPGRPRWARLSSARRAGDHLFLRYRFEESR